MSWTFDQPSRTWTYTNSSATARDVVVFNQQARGDVEYRLTVQSYLHEVMALVRSSPDGKDAWEIGFTSIGNSQDSNLKSSAPRERRYAFVIRPVASGNTFTGADAGTEYDPFWGFPLAFFPFNTAPRTQTPTGDNTQDDYDSNTVIKMLPECGLAYGDVDRPITYRIRMVGSKIEVFLSTQADQSKPLLSVQSTLYYANPQRLGFRCGADTTSFPTYTTDMGTTTGPLNQTPVSDSRFDYPATADDKWRDGTGASGAAAGFGAGGTNAAVPVAITATTPSVAVRDAEVYTITERVIPYSRQLCIVGGGRLYVSTDNTSPVQVGGLDMPPGRPLSAAVFQQAMYIVGGGQARVYDPTSSGAVVTKWDPTEGRNYVTNDDVRPLPGQSRNSVLGIYEAGTTTANGICAHINRIWLYDFTDDPQNIKACATGDPMDWDFESRIAGRAFQTSTEIAGVIGKPVRCLAPARDDLMIVGCSDEIYVMAGDPVFDDARTDLVSKDVGILNFASFAFSNDAVAYVMTQEGPAKVTGNQFASLTLNRLTKYAYPHTHGGDVYTLLGRDARRRGVLACYTRVNADGTALPNQSAYYQSPQPEQSIHLWIDERTGGFFPVKFPQGADPTCFCVHNSELHIGCRDGKIRKMSDLIHSDEDTDGSDVAIPAYMPLRLVTPFDIAEMYKIVETEIVMGAGSSESMLNFHTAPTAEEVYEIAFDTIQNAAYVATVVAGRNTKRNRVRGNAIVAVISNVNVGETFRVEGVQIRFGDAGPERHNA